MLLNLLTVPSITKQALNALNLIECDGDRLLIKLPIIWSLSSAIPAFVYSVASIGILLVTATLIIVIILRKRLVFKSASVPFLIMSLIGLLLLFAASIINVQSPITNNDCSSLLWIAALGFQLTFAPLFLKTWRIYRIFGMKTLSVVKMSDRKLFAFTSIFIIWDLLLLSIWQGTDPLIASDVSVTVNDRIHLYHHCQLSSSNSTGMRIGLVLSITKGALILFGALMGFATRRVSTTYAFTVLIIVSHFLSH